MTTSGRYIDYGLVDPEDFWRAIAWGEEVGYYFENSWSELQVVLKGVRRNLRAEERKRNGAVRRGKPAKLVSHKKDEQIQSEEKTIEESNRGEKLKLDIYRAMEKRGRRGVRNNVQETHASIQDYAEGLGVTLDGDDLDPGLGEGGNDATGIDDEQGGGQQPAFSSHTVFSALDEIRVSCTPYLVSTLL
jgi:hypothetical protein